MNPAELVTLRARRAEERRRLDADYARRDRERHEWASRYGLRLSRRHGCIRGLLGQLCHEGHFSDGWLDHAELFTYEGRPAVLVSQPYGVTRTGMAVLADLAEHHGLDFGVELCGRGWYGHGTIMVEVWRSPELYRRVVDCRGDRCAEVPA